MNSGKTIATLATLTLCLSSFAAMAATSGNLTWAGCGITKKAFMQELAAAYERETGRKIDIEGGGATKGIRKVANLESDMGGTCRYLLRGDPAESGVKPFPVAWDALAVIAHKDNPVESVSLSQLTAILEGRLTNWKDLGGPDAPIELASRKSKISGVGYALRQLVFADETREFAGTDAFPSSGPLEQAVVGNTNAIGVTGISSARKRDVKIIRLEDKDPSYDNIMSGEYLLYRPLYIVSNVTNPNYPEVRRFVDFANSREGRDIIRANGVVPYLEATHLIRKQLQQWKMADRLRQMQSATPPEPEQSGHDDIDAGSELAALIE